MTKSKHATYSHLDDVIVVNVLPRTTVGHGFDFRSGKSNYFKFVFAATPLSTQYLGVRAKTGLLGVKRLVYPWIVVAVQGKFAYFKRVIRSRKSKDRQYHVFKQPNQPSKITIYWAADA
jgi:hypothetical protein